MVSFYLVARCAFILALVTHAYAATTVNNCGVSQTVSTAPTRVITMNQGATEFMLALGLHSSMVGTAYLDDAIWPKYRKTYESIPVLASGYPDETTILAQNPDFIVASYSSAFREQYVVDGKTKGIFSPATIAPCTGQGSDWGLSWRTCRPQLHNRNIGTYLFEDACEDTSLRPSSVKEETVYQEMQALGAIFGVDVQPLIDEMKADFDEAASLVSGLMHGQPLKTVWLDCIDCCKVGAGAEKQFYVGGGTGAPNMLMQEAGLKNAFSDRTGNWVCVNVSDIIAVDPDVIVVVEASWDPAMSKIKALYEDNAFCQLSAVRGARFVEIPFSATTLSPRNGPAALDLAIAAVHVRTGANLLPQESGVRTYNPNLLRSETANSMCPLTLTSILYGDDFAQGKDCQQLTVDFILTEGEAVLSAIEDDIRMDLSEVGITVNTRTLPKDSWNTAAQSGDFNMAFSETWGPPYDPHSYAKSWLVPDEAHYAALKGLLHPLTQEALGQKIDSVLTSTNEKARQSLWRDILSRLHDQAIDLPISGKRIPAVINKNRLSGYVPGHQQFDYPVHNLQVVSGSKTITVAPGAQTGLFQGVGRLDPHTYRPNEFFSNNWVYEGLVEYGLDGAILPSLATHWTIADTSDGGQEYTFHLRQGVTFHDGEQWNCAAAKLNFDHVLAKPLTTGDFHGWYGLPEQVSNWVCKSTYELVVTTKTKYYPLLQEMCYIRPLRFLSPAKFVGGASSDPLTQNSCHGGPFTAFGLTVTCAGIQAPAGTGRWRYDQTTKKTDGTVQEVIFQRNTAHWAPASGDVETLRLVHYDSHDAVKAALVDGTLDLVVGGGVLNPKDVREFRTTRAADFDVVLTEPLQNRIVILNSAKAPTNDVQVRKTIMHAVNKAAIIEKELFGLADPVDTLFPKTAPYCHLDLTPRWDFDLEKAHFLNCQSTSPCTCNCNCNVQNTPPSSGNSDVVAPPGGGASGVVINMYNSGGCPGTS